MVLDALPLWRGNHVSIKQLCEDFAQYLYLPRLKNRQVLLDAIAQGISMLQWAEDGFAYAQDFDKDRNRYVGLTGGKIITVHPDGGNLLVKANVAASQLKVDSAAATVVAETVETIGSTTVPGVGRSTGKPSVTAPDLTTIKIQPRRFFGSVKLDPTRLGRDAGKIAEEIISHLVGLQGSNAELTLEIEVRVPDGVPDNVIRTVTENCRTLKFTNAGFEES